MRRISFALCVAALALLWIDDSCGSDGSEQDAKSVDVDAFLERWQEQRQSIEEFSAEFVLFQYDDVFKVERRGRGTIYFSSPKNAWYDIQPAEVEGRKSRKEDRHGARFQLRPAEAETWLWHDGLYSKFEKGEHEGTTLVGPGAWGPVAEDLVLFDVHLKLAEHCEWKCIEIDKSEIRLEGRPVSERTIRAFRKVTVVLDRKSLLPSAMQVVDPTGRTEAVFVFTEFRTNKSVRAADREPPVTLPDSEDVAQTNRKRPQASEPRRLYSADTIRVLKEQARAENPSHRAEALEALHAALPAREFMEFAVPFLVDDDESIRGTVRDLLAATESGEMKTVVSVAGAINEAKTPRQLAQAIGRIPAGSRLSGPLLPVLAEHTESDIRDEVVHAAVRIGETDERVRRLLMRALLDESMYVSQSAADAIEKLTWKSADGTITPLLLKDMRSDNRSVRLKAIRCLGKLGPSASGAKAALKRACGSDDRETQFAALRAFHAVGGESGFVLDRVRKLLASDDAGVRRDAVKLLGSMGPQAAPTLDALCRTLNDEDASVAAAALEAIKNVQKETAVTHR